MNLSFSQRYALIGKKAARINLSPAKKAAEELVNDFPHYAKAYFLLNLVSCLCGDLEKSPALVKKAESNCQDFTVTLCGDMQRDHIIGIARFGARNDYDFARTTLEPLVQQAHQRDMDRLACLEGAIGQLAYSEGNYALSLQHHLTANALWADLGDWATGAWIELNTAYWLRTAIALEGHSSTSAQRLKQLLAGTSHSHHARILCLPNVGVLLYDWLLCHRQLPIPL